MLKTLLLICLIFLNFSFAYARSHSIHGENFLRHWDVDREISDFNKGREREFRNLEERHLSRVWETAQRAEIIFFHTVPNYITSSKYFAYQHIRLGTDDLHKGNFTQAVVEFTKAIETCPDLAVAYHLRAIAYNRLMQYDKALVDIYKADQLGSTDSTSFINMIKREASHQGAMAEFQLGLNDMHLNNNDQAIMEYTKAIEIFPEMAEAYYSRGTAYYKKAEYAKALADVNKAAELGFPVKPDLIIVIKDSGNLPQTIEDLTQAIYTDPDNERLYFRRGLCYKKKKNYAQAIADETRAIEINPNYGNAYRSRGACYFYEKDYTNSWADMMKAQDLGIHLNPDIMNKLRQALAK